MSSVVIYTGPPRVDLGLVRTGMYFVSRDQIPEQIKKAIETDSAFANYFEDLERFRLKPPPGSHAFGLAKIAQAPPQRRTLIHPPLRRMRRIT